MSSSFEISIKFVSVCGLSDVHTASEFEMLLSRRIGIGVQALRVLYHTITPYVRKKHLIAPQRPSKEGRTKSLMTQPERSTWHYIRMINKPNGLDSDRHTMCVRCVTIRQMFDSYRTTPPVWIRISHSVTRRRVTEWRSESKPLALHLQVQKLQI